MMMGRAKHFEFEQGASAGARASSVQHTRENSMASSAGSNEDIRMYLETQRQLAAGRIANEAEDRLGMNCEMVKAVLMLLCATIILFWIAWASGAIQEYWHKAVLIGCLGIWLFLVIVTTGRMLLLKMKRYIHKNIDVIKLMLHADFAQETMDKGYRNFVKGGYRAIHAIRR